MKHKQRKRVIFFILMLVLTLIACLLILEIGVRTFFEGPKYLCTIYAKDDALGYKLKPHAKMIIDFNYFKQNVTLNSLGLRDREYEPKKPGEHRILALGDSFLFGAVWDANQTFVKVFERELNKDNAREHAVINAGVSGYGSYEEKEFLKRDGIKFSPDTVLYFFYQNDIESDLGAPQSTVLDNGCAASKASLELPALSMQRFKNWLVLHSRAYVYFRFILINENAWLRNALYKVRNVLVDLNLAQPGKLQYTILQSKYDQATSDGWNATLKNIDEMSVLARQNNMKYAIVMIPMKFQAYEELWQDYKQRNRITDEQYDFGQPARILATAAEKNNIAFIDLTPLLRNAVKEQAITEPLYYEGDAHFNVFGNEVVGKILAEELQRQALAGDAR